MSKRTESFTTAKYLLLNAADAIERVMTSYKEVIELSGYTSICCDMFETFERIKSNDLTTASRSIVQSKGVVYESSFQNSIKIDKISVVTPNGDTIVPCLSLDIQPGMNLLITGENRIL